MKNILFIICSFLFSGELEVDGDLKVSGNVVFQDETSINTAPTLLPHGVIVPYAGINPPEGWLLCHGQEVSRTEYSDLFSVLLITYGVGDQITTFNLPDLRGRMLLGLDNMGGISADRVESEQADVLGGSAGEEMHELTVDEMPTHNHSFVAVIGGGHGDAGSGLYTDYQDLEESNTNYSGNSQPHNNMPPYLAVNYIIKY